jgi:ribonuclease Z
VIDILFLGNGAMIPTPRRNLSSFLMRVGSKLILFDVGEGTQIPWQSSGWGFKRLDTICISHWHADHIAGLPGVLHGLANAGRTEPVTIIGPKGTRAVAAGLREIAQEMPYPLITADLTTGQSWTIGPLQIRVLLGDHRVPVLLYRFDLPRNREFLVDRAMADKIPRDLWARLTLGEHVSENGRSLSPDTYLGPERRGLSIGVMTDTRPTDVASAFLADVDLLIAEGTYGDPSDQENARRNKHMTFAEAASVASHSRARQLILTHFSPKMDDPGIWIDQATSIFPETRLAVPGREFTLRYERQGVRE